MLAITICVSTAQSCKYRVSPVRGLKLFNIKCQLYQEEHVSVTEPTLIKITKFISEFASRYIFQSYIYKMEYNLDQPIFIIMVLSAHKNSGYEPLCIYGTTHGLSFSAILL